MSNDFNKDLMSFMNMNDSAKSILNYGNELIKSGVVFDDDCDEEDEDDEEDE